MTKLQLLGIIAMFAAVYFGHCLFAENEQLRSQCFEARMAGQ